MGQGRDNARLYLVEHADVRDKLDKAARLKLGLPKPELAPAKPAASQTSGATAQTA
jgi:hypothetical protein